MKTTSWNYAVNPLPQFKYGSVNLRDEPWWLALAGWAIGAIVGRGCCLLHWIKMPKFLRHVDHDNEYTWHEWYGDLGSIFHVRVFNPLFQWHYSHPAAKTYTVEIGYDKVREIFRDSDPGFFTEEDNHAAQYAATRIRKEGNQ